MLASIGKYILNFFLTKVIGWLTSIVGQWIAAYQAKKKNKEVREKTEKAKTKEEIDEAAQDVIDNF